MKKREILLGNPAFKKFNRTLMIFISKSSMGIQVRQSNLKHLVRWVFEVWKK